MVRPTHLIEIINGKATGNATIGLKQRASTKTRT